jgi:predicted nucleic acid-binding protein
VKAYIDSSVVLRVVLSQPESLREWSDIVLAVGSGLVEVECLRTIDRYRLTGDLSAEEAGTRRAAVFDVLGRMELIELTRAVLHRAAQPMPAPLGTLDAIHLATAEFWREARDDELVFATHDRALALAARASGFEVIGITS